ncbi:L-aspartate oxidase [Maribacter polysiphoniae]|uniref:L-aspartate oxidase n=1 Tax=Maribacter polysiphoniae TaxID=429344 RepID=A0A316DX30_9FLAO|nr:L-aspartate oxidase [Maribacter polysiphoniae]MBD1263009.1 L-aspartate oxidase [Maribacter polysiphoniae]PWK22058.1 L-aspartate oxidase [Maribacter polysiphoniae]
MVKTNYLVIGSGVAGLTFAVKMAEKHPERNIIIVTKGDEDESNTKYAQGGIAVVLDMEEDSFQKHIHDTLVAGDGLCDKDVVEMVVKEGPKRLKELIAWEANFDLNSEGDFDLGKEGGHSEYRVVHHKDVTGYEVERALLQRVHQLPNIELLAHHFAINLITDHQLERQSANGISCYGAYVLNQKNGEILTIKADHTLLASGGIGRVYGHTTNPIIATGDGIAMAYRAKALIKDMEFIQFHPTALYNPEGGSYFLISEAVRGFGAYLRNKAGYRFMPDYDDRAELASRDIVSQCIDNELKKSGDTHVFLDCTHLDMVAFKKHFPNIYDKCLEYHIDVEKDWIPVVPASHYLCGGIVVDKQGKTSIDNLFACGECSRTGLHGANRLASNSLLEALVYAHNIFKYLSVDTLDSRPLNIPDWNDEGTSIPKEHVLIQHNLKELQALMRNYVGIVRSNKRLHKAIARLDLIYREVEELYKESKITTTLCELRNMVNVAHVIISQSLEQKENRGGYFNKDYQKEGK